MQSLEVAQKIQHYPIQPVTVIGTSFSKFGNFTFFRNKVWNPPWFIKTRHKAEFGEFHMDIPFSRSCSEWFKGKTSKLRIKFHSWMRLWATSFEFDECFMWFNCNCKFTWIYCTPLWNMFLTTWNKMNYIILFCELLKK